MGWYNFVRLLACLFVVTLLLYSTGKRPCHGSHITGVMGLSVIITISLDMFVLWEGTITLLWNHGITAVGFCPCKPSCLS